MIPFTWHPLPSTRPYRVRAWRRKWQAIREHYGWLR